MSVLSIDGVEICQLDPETTDFLKRLAAGGPGHLREPAMIEVPEARCVGARALAGGALADRTFEEKTDLSLQIRFRRYAHAIQNTWPR